MVIKASAATEIRSLVQALSARDEVRRESAIARLAVIGARAVPHILGAYREAADRRARLAMMRALELSADPRAASIARAAVSSGGDLAIASIGVLRGLLDSTKGDTGPQALDALMAAALDTRAERRVRLAALDALRTIPDVSDRITEVMGTLNPDGDQGSEDAAWRDALEGQLPDDPRLLRAGLNAHGGTAALSALQKLVDRIRAREAESDHGWEDWRALRGALHQTLALRGSRVALYDLRETFETADPGLPASFLGAAQLVGDSTCLEPLAAAHDRAGQDDRWRGQIAAAFRAIVARERITRRHAVMKRILHRWPDAGRQLMER